MRVKDDCSYCSHLFPRSGAVFNLECLSRIMT